MKWRYGDSWEKFPLEAGELWQAQGSRVMVWDLFNGLPDFMLEADLVYCDPPWNTSNLNSFYTKAYKPEGHNTFEAFVQVLFGCVEAIAPPVCYLEIGKQNVERFREALAGLYPHVQIWAVTYYKRHTSYLVRGGYEPTAYDFSGRDDMDTPRLAMEQEAFECVADLCMGRGLTGITAYELGQRFVGTELNKRRLAVLLDKTAEKGALWEKGESSTIIQPSAIPCQLTML